MNYIYGYHRVSTKEQHLERGIDEITAYCDLHNLRLEKIFTDKATGKTFDRPRYTVLKEDVLKPGDILIVTELDRLGRTKRDTMNELQFYKDHSIRLMVLELPTTLVDLNQYDNSLAQLMLETINNMMLELYASMAQAEMEKRQKRQAEGIVQMKARGEWFKYGRPRVMDLDDFQKHYARVESGEISGYALMKELRMSNGTFYRYVKSLSK